MSTGPGRWQDDSGLRTDRMAGGDAGREFNKDEPRQGSVYLSTFAVTFALRVGWLSG